MIKLFHHNTCEAPLNKSELIAAVAQKADISSAAAGRVVNALTETITATLKAGESLALVGFGTFEVRSRAARTGRNPQTGKELKISASKIPAFKAGKGLKDAVN